jgi:hypothetical protein
MPKKKNTKYEFEVESYGRYTQWDNNSKELPKIKKFTTTIEAEEDIEFGCILRIKKAKGNIINFTINHPKFKDSSGKTAAPFTGEYFINSNNFRFFIGDRIWLPLEDKKGTWEIIVKIGKDTLLRKNFSVV